MSGCDGAMVRETGGWMKYLENGRRFARAESADKLQQTSTIWVSYSLIDVYAHFVGDIHKLKVEGIEK